MPKLARSSVAKALLALAVPVCLTFAAPADASTLSFTPCPEAAGYSCSALEVPLDHAGRLPGAITLSVERRLSGSRPSTDAVLALAGGPGQSILPLREFVAKSMAPALASRDLLLFDQRGTGSSDPLRCSALEAFSSPGAAALERCALGIGPARGDFTTAESVEDIEALRRAAGYEKLVLYGTSYGTKVALDYAERYPAHVESLVLDSVVPAGGKDPFQVASFQAVAAMLDEVCGGGACAGVTADPVRDLARLSARLRHRALRGPVYDGKGRRHTTTLGPAELFGVLSAGDLNPALRALLPAAVRSALGGDAGPLLRLSLLARGLIPGTSAAATPESEVDEPLFWDTSCEETPFPWNREAPAPTRLLEAAGALSSLPAGDFYPFDRATALGVSLVGPCSRWPDASAAPAPQAALPNVPTLLLSGAQDLRTPTSLARAVAAAIPDAQLLVVPFTGHSVLGSDLSECSSRAVAAFFAGAAVAACTDTPNHFAPTPVTPTHLSAVHPPAGLGGRPGRTLVAALDAIVDLNRQVIGATLEANRELPSGSSFGGLRGGYAKLTSSALVLRRFSFVPGVALSGTFPLRGGALQSATIRVSGSLAAGGSVRIGAGFKHVSGTLGGRHFSLAVARVRLSRNAPAGWPALAQLHALLGGLRQPAAPTGRG
jgi:pimeloyl-ACP methyl ester carboxylesterase